MKRINVTLVSPNKVLSAYKNDSEYQSWIDNCIAQGVWGQTGNYSIEILDATAELEAIRLSKQAVSKSEFDSHANSTLNPHSVTKDQVGLSNVPNTDATLRSNHTGTQLSSTISDFNEAAQDAIGNVLTNSADINFLYPDANNQISAELSTTGVVSGTYSLVTVDTKGRITVGSNTGSITRYSAFNSNSATNNTAAYTTVTQLTLPSLPTGLYRFFFSGLMQSTATTSGIGVRIGAGTATLSTVNGKWNISQGTNGVSHDFEYDQTTANDNITSASVAAANTNFGVNGMGLFRVTVAGTVTIQIRSETNGQTATLQPDSAFIVELV